MLSMAIDGLDGVLACETDFSRRYTNDLPIFPVEVEDVVVPGALKVFDKSPEWA
jgi:hypothetical protein